MFSLMVGRAVMACGHQKSFAYSVMVWSFIKNAVIGDADEGRTTALDIRLPYVKGGLACFRLRRYGY
jgi:hypothetical protein